MNNKAKKLSKQKKQTSGKTAVKPAYSIANDNRAMWLVWISWIFCLLAGILLSLKQLREPDLWWIMRTGEWILENGHPPFKDWFSYTMYEESWMNVKWGFEVVSYLFNRIGGPEFVYVLQALVATGILVLGLRIYQSLKFKLLGHSQASPFTGLILASYLALITLEFRLNGRPEMVSHFFVMGYALVLMKYHQSPGRFIFWLIPLQIIWTNFHEAYGTGIVMLGAFTVGEWVDARFWPNQITGFQRREAPWHLTATTLFAILAMAVNPRGFEMILHPWNIYNQLGANQFTTELFSFTHPNYWQYQGQMNMVFLALTVVGLFFRFKNTPKESKWYFRPFTNVGSGYLLFLGMFFYLSLTAYRNIPFFVLISFPWVALVLDQIFEVLKSYWPFYRRKPAIVTRMGYGLLVLMGIGIYISIASGTYYEAFDRNEKFGLQVDATKNPADAAKFIEENGIEGRCFSDYLTSSYLMWHFRPDFYTFIDLRDLDVFPPEFFNRFAQMVKFPKVFRQAEELYGFDYVVLYRAEYPKLHQHLFQSRDYEPLYADPVAAVYAKKDSVSQKVVEEYGYQTGQQDIFKNNEKISLSGPARLVNKLFWPFYEADDYSEVNFDAIAAQFYQNVGELEMARKKAEKAIKHATNAFRGHVAMGNLMLKYAGTASNQSSSNQYYSNAYHQFQQAYELNPENEAVLNNLGRIEMNYGNLEKAEKYLEEAIDQNPLSSSGYHSLARLYQRKAAQAGQRQQEYLQKQVAYLEKAYQIDKDNFTLELELGAAYCRLSQCDKAMEFLTLFESGQRTQLLNAQNKKVVKNCLDKCR